MQLIGGVITLKDAKEDKYARRTDAFVVTPDGRDHRCPERQKSLNRANAIVEIKTLIVARRP